MGFVNLRTLLGIALGGLGALGYASSPLMSGGLSETGFVRVRILFFRGRILVTKLLAPSLMDFLTGFAMLATCRISSYTGSIVLLLN